MSGDGPGAHQADDGDHDSPRTPEEWLEADLRHFDRIQRRRGHGSGSSDADRVDRPSRRRRRGRGRRRWYRRPRNIVLTILVLLLVLVGGYLVALDRLLAGTTRAPLLAAFDGPASRGQNLLLIGSATPAGSLEVDRATSVVQLVHLSADHTRAEVVYFPRDLYLPAPESGRYARIEDVYARNGTPGITQMIQEDVGLRIDHVLQVGFGGYAHLTDLVGGVDVETGQGVRHLSGAQAQAWNDEPTDSLTTGRRNQEWLKQMLTQVLDPAIVLNPVKVYRILHTMTDHTVADRAFSTGEMRGLLWSARDLRPDRIRYLTVPHAGFARRHGHRVLLPDVASLQQLGAAINADSAAGIAAFDR